MPHDSNGQYKGNCYFDQLRGVLYFGRDTQNVEGSTSHACMHACLADDIWGLEEIVELAR